MPVLYILAGPNGTGKTTFFSFAIENGFIDPKTPFVNVDLLTQKFGPYNEENYAQATAEYRRIVQELIRDKLDFIIESNLSESRSYDWIDLVKSKGYEFFLFYLSTDDVAINIGRVKSRVAEGGHDIAEAIIISRYNQSHSYLKYKLSVFNEVYLIDNSTETPQVEIQIRKGMVLFREDKLTKWVASVMEIHDRLHK